MRDLLLKCPNCDASLAFDHKLAGRTLACPSCKGQLAVPVPDASFACPSCNADLHTSSGVVGEFECPACKGAIVIGSEPAMAETPKRSAKDPQEARQGRRCQGCSADLPGYAVICVRCGRDLRTGMTVPQFVEPTAIRGAVEKPSSVGVAVALYWASWGLTALGSLFAARPLMGMLPGGVIIALAAILLALSGGWTWLVCAKTNAGRSWPRVVLLVLALLGAPFAVLHLFRDVARNPLGTVFDVLGYAMSCAIVFMLFTRGSSEWFKANRRDSDRSTGAVVAITLTLALLVPFIAAIAIPSFAKANQITQQKACVNNLLLIDAAKEQWAYEKSKDYGVGVGERDVAPYLTGKTMPACPAEGRYTLNPVGVMPECSVHGTIDESGIPIPASPVGAEGAHSGVLPPLPVCADGKWGYVDRTGALAILPTYEDAGNFSDDRAWVKTHAGYACIDMFGQPVSSEVYEDANEFSEGYAAVKRKEGWGYVDTNGTVVVKPAYSSANEFHEGLAAVRGRVLNGEGSMLQGYIDTNGTMVIAPAFLMAGNFCQGRAVVVPADANADSLNMGVIDRSGAYVVPPEWPFIRDFSEGLAGFVNKGSANPLDGPFGFMGLDGAMVISPTFSDVGQFQEGVAYARLGDKVGFIDKAGRVVIAPRFDGATTFSEGLGGVVVSNRCGSIDHSGAEVIAPRFDFIMPFQGNVAAVVVGDKLGYINPSGAYVWEPTHVSTNSQHWGAIELVRQFHLDSQVALARRYMDGMGVERDLNKALSLLLGPAEKGHPEAQFRLGRLYHGGDGVTPDYRKSVEWLGRAADQGYTVAAQALDALYVEATEASFDVFSRKGLPEFRNDPDLAPVSDATADMKARLKFPTTKECDQLIASCNRVLDGMASNDLKLAAFGSLLRFTYERDAQDKGYQRRGGELMDAASIAEREARQAQRNRSLAEDRRIQGLQADAEEREAALRRLQRFQRDESRLWSDDERRVRRLGGANSSPAEQYRNWRNRVEREATEARRAAEEAAMAKRSGSSPYRSEAPARATERGSASSQCPGCDGTGEVYESFIGGAWIPYPQPRRDLGFRGPVACEKCNGTGRIAGGDANRSHPSMGHANPWGKAGARIVGRYDSYNAACRAKERMAVPVQANLNALAEQLINAGDASTTVQRPPEYRIEYDPDGGVWLLIEQKF